MPTLRIFLVYNLFNSILLYFVPKKLRGFLPPSWYPNVDLDDQKNKKTPLPLLTPSSPSSSSSSRSSPSLTLKRMDPLELKRVFQMFDKNGDGSITKQELNDSLENLGIFIPDKELGQMIEKIDVNGDGCVDIDEFGSLYKTIMNEQDEEEDMREAFNVFDQNGDGFITVDELKSVLSSLGIKQGKTFEDCKKMIKQVDADGDGRVNYREFREMMKAGGFGALG